MPETILEQTTAGIADAEGVAPEDLDTTLENCVSTDAILSLVQHESNAWRLQFETPNHVVEITGNNTVRVDGEHVGTVPD